MKIFDCFTYFNEEEIIRIRFEELGDIVDYFVVVEASQTFTGINKPFYFDNLSSWINEWKEKVIRIKIDFPSNVNTSWLKEHFQRNSISLGLKNANPNDIVLISDADEIPKKEILKLSTFSETPTKLDVRQYFWNFNWQVPDHCNQGARPIIAKKSDLDLYSAQELRSMTLPIIPDGGWHFSFFGEAEKIKSKIESFSHTEYDLDDYKNYENILNRIENGVDPFDRFPLKYSEIDHTYPNFVQRSKCF